MLTLSLDTGIYAIEHVDSCRMYIGSAVNFGARWRVHLCLLRKGAHHSTHLQAAWDKYGETAFLFKRLVVCSKENMLMYEQLLIDGYRVFESKFGFNGRRNASSQLGMKHSEETLAKIRAKRATQVFSQETKDIWSKNRTGRKMPDWFPESVSKRMKGFKHSDATKAVISAKGVGRPVSQTTRESKSKITFDQVETIKSRASAGMTQAQLATEFSLSQSSISLIVSGKRWANLPSVT